MIFSNAVRRHHPLAHSDSLSAASLKSSPCKNFFHQQRAAAICFGRAAALQPERRAACFALGDNVLSVPRKRERTVLRGVPPPRKFLLTHAYER